MYMANVELLRWGPNATYIPLARVGVLHWGNANSMFRIGSNANFSVFRYQHVGIPNAKFRVGGSKPMLGPNARAFAFQWNIGFRITLS